MIHQQKLNMLIYCFENYKSKEKQKKFYEQVQTILDEIPHNEPTVYSYELH